MTSLDVLGERNNSHFGLIFHLYILCNDCCHGLHDDDNQTRKIFRMDSSAIAAAQTEGGIKLKVAKENENQKENKVKKCIMSTNQDGCTQKEMDLQGIFCQPQS